MQDDTAHVIVAAAAHTQATPAAPAQAPTPAPAPAPTPTTVPPPQTPAPAFPSAAAFTFAAALTAGQPPATATVAAQPAFPAPQPAPTVALQPAPGTVLPLAPGQPAPATYTFTPVPAAGWPGLEGLGIERLLENLEPTQIPLLDAIPGPKLRFVPSGTGQGDANRRNAIVEHTAGMMSTWLNGPRPDISYPRPANLYARAPIGWVASGMTQLAHDQLLAQGVLSTRQLTVFILPYNRGPTELVGLLRGFTVAGTPAQDEAAVLDAVRRTIRQDAYIRNLTTRSRDAVPAQFTDAVEGVAISAHVFPLDVHERGGQGITIRLYSFFVPPPTNHPDLRAAFYAHLRNVTYVDGIRGEARIDLSGDYDNCSTCHTRTHPTGCCPFSKVPGWNGHIPKERAVLPASHGLPTPPPAPRGNRGGPRARGNRGGYNARGSARGDSPNNARENKRARQY